MFDQAKERYGKAKNTAANIKRLTIKTGKIAGVGAAVVFIGIPTVRGMSESDPAPDPAAESRANPESATRNNSGGAPAGSKKKSKTTSITIRNGAYFYNSLADYPDKHCGFVGEEQPALQVGKRKGDMIAVTAPAGGYENYVDAFGEPCKPVTLMAIGDLATSSE